MRKYFNSFTSKIVIQTIFLTVFLYINISGQSQKYNLSAGAKIKTDSLWNVLKKAKHDTSKIKIYFEIGYVYESEMPDSALFSYNNALQLADNNIKDFKLGYDLKSLKKVEKKFLSLKATSLRYLGIVSYVLSRYDNALGYQLKALKLYEELSEKKGISASLNNVGNVHFLQGNYDKALEYYIKALKIKEESGDKKGMSNSYNNIGNVYSKQGSDDKAIEYYSKALKIFENSGDKKGMSACYNNIGEVHNNLGRYNESIEYFSKALKITEELDDKNGITDCCGNLGNAYTSQGNYNKAMTFYLKALQIDEEIGDKEGEASIYENIAFLNILLADSENLSQIQKNNYLNKAVEFGTKAIELAHEINALPRVTEASNVLMKAYKKQGNFRKSIEFAEIFISTKDSMFKEEKTNAMAEMETKYQSDKKQLIIEKLDKEKELQSSEMKKQRLIILFVACGLLFVLGLAITLFRLFLLKKKANKIITEKKEALQIAYQEINSQKEEIIVQRDSIQAQKEVIEEHQKEILDSINYAQRIQQAVMPCETNININLNQKTEVEQNMQLFSDIQSNLFILFRPKDIVSGDFYWSTRIGDISVITVVDCTGHGVPGAFMSMLGISFLNEIVSKKEITKASAILDQLRVSVIDALKQQGTSVNHSILDFLVQDGMDISLCAINVKTLEMQFAGANNPVWIVKKVESYKVESEKNTENNITNFTNFTTLQTNNFTSFELYELKGDNQPIGIYGKMKPFTNYEYQLQKGDTIYLMSDGYEDQFGGVNRKKFQSKNLKTLITENCHLPMIEQKEILEKTFDDWKSNSEQIDDVTLIGIKIQ